MLHLPVRVTDAREDVLIPVPRLFGEQAETNPFKFLDLVEDPRGARERGAVAGSAGIVCVAKARALVLVDERGRKLVLPHELIVGVAPVRREDKHAARAEAATEN